VTDSAGLVNILPKGELSVPSLFCPSMRWRDAIGAVLVVSNFSVASSRKVSVGLSAPKRPLSFWL